jgi:hypothetical protein
VQKFAAMSSGDQREFLRGLNEKEKVYLNEQLVLIQLKEGLEEKVGAGKIETLTQPMEGRVSGATFCGEGYALSNEQCDPSDYGELAKECYICSVGGNMKADCASGWKSKKHPKWSIGMYNCYSECDNDCPIGYQLNDPCLSKCYASTTIKNPCQSGFKFEPYVAPKGGVSNMRYKCVLSEDENVCLWTAYKAKQVDPVDGDVVCVDVSCPNQITRISLQSSQSHASWARFTQPLGNYIIVVGLDYATYIYDPNSKSSNLVRLGIGRMVGDDLRYFTYNSGDPNNKQEQVYVLDRMSNASHLISKNNNGEQANENAVGTAISADGTVVFRSFADNLTAADNNHTYDVFLHDISTGNTELVSKTTSGTSGDGPSLSGDISSDGSIIVYTSLASNLTTGVSSNDIENIFIYDRRTDDTTLVSKGIGNEKVNGGSIAPMLSPSGQYAVFFSKATNLVDDNVDDSLGGLYLYNVATESISRIVAFNNTSGYDYEYGRPLRFNDRIKKAAVDNNGRFIVFATDDIRNEVPNDTNSTSDVYVHDHLSKTTVLLTKAPNGDAANSSSYQVDITANGECIIFSSYASNLVSNDSPWTLDVFWVRNPFILGSGS